MFGNNEKEWKLKNLLSIFTLSIWSIHESRMHSKLKMLLNDEFVNTGTYHQMSL